MGNVMRILRRDIRRLFKAPAALVVVLAIIVLPSAYTWYNVAGFWNPYESTGNLRICVANDDAGGLSELTGELNVGNQIVEQLHENNQLGWQFVSRDEAMREVEAGQAYAAFIIPEDFTQNLLSVTTGTFTQPEILYYVNEKLGPVAPKITDTGATTLDETINAAFVATVSNAVAQTADTHLADSKGKIENARSLASEKLSDGIVACSQIASSLSAMSDATQSAQSRATNASVSIDAAKTQIQDAATALDEISGLASELQGIVGTLGEAQVVADAAQALGSALDGKASETGGTSENAREQIGEKLGALSSSAATISKTLAEQEVLADQSKLMLERLGKTMSTTTEVLDQTRSLVDDLQSSLETARTDILAIEGSNALQNAFGSEGIDAERFASFMQSPAEIVTEQIYPLNAYGSAMAPLFMNLTFWIGAFMLLVIIRQEVDDEDLSNLTLSQRYLGRFLLFALLAILQAIVCCTGCLVMGVQAVSVWAFFLAAICSSLTYLSIIYALSVTLQHIGKGICIVLVFAQIPGATGLYPIEMTSSFFQAIYHFFPFTYGIGAMREAICGLYSNAFATNLGMLALFFAIFMTMGLLVRPFMSNVNRMVAREICESGIFNGEDVEVPMRRFRFSQIMRALTQREEYRAELAQRYERLQRNYPRLIAGAIILGLGVPIVIGIIFALTPTEKTITLALWTIWIIIVFVFLIVVESLRFSIERQQRLEHMSDAELHELYENRHRMGSQTDGGAR